MSFFKWIFIQRLEHNLLTMAEVMIKWDTGEIPWPPMGQIPGCKWKHWGSPHFWTVNSVHLRIQSWRSNRPFQSEGTVRFLPTFGHLSSNFWSLSNFWPSFSFSNPRPLNWMKEGTEGRKEVDKGRKEVDEGRKEGRKEVRKEGTEGRKELNEGVWYILKYFAQHRM